MIILSSDSGQTQAEPTDEERRQAAADLLGHLPPPKPDHQHEPQVNPEPDSGEVLINFPDNTRTRRAFRTGGGPRSELTR